MTAGRVAGGAEVSRSMAGSGARVGQWWPILAFMLLSFGGSGAFSPYLQLQFKQRGLDSVQIGLLTGVGPALAMFVPLLWGVAGDRSRRTRLLLVVTSSAAAAAFMLVSLPLAFPALVAAVALFNAFSLGGGPLGTALILGEAERLKMDYGSLRMWGSVGFAVGILVAGRLVSRFGLISIFAAYSLPVVLSLLPLKWVREAGVRARPPRLGQIGAILANRGLLALLLVTLLWRVTASAYYTFFTIYITDLGASPTLVSLAWATALVGEVTVLRLSGGWVRRIGVRGLLLLGLGGSMVRWAVYAVTPSPIVALPFQLLHGLTFGATTTAAVLAVDRIFPGELRSTGQGLLNIVMWGLGGLLGSLGAGALAEAVGYRWLFATSAVGTAVTLVIALVTLHLEPVAKEAPSGA